MKIVASKFCSLSTSPSWQAWLFNYDAKLYKIFITKLRAARGCNQNSDVMIETLKEIDSAGGTAKLLEFLRSHYPHMLVIDDRSKQTHSDVNIFPYYNPNILTYPRRQIFSGDDVEFQVKEFLINKISSDYVIINGKAYVEYLESSDIHVKDKVPLNNWLIAQWRTNNG